MQKVVMHRFKPLFAAGVVACLLTLGAPVAADNGVNVGKASSVRNLVPAEALENQANQQYRQMLQQAADQRALGTDNNAQVQRLRRIQQRLLPYTYRWNPRAQQWQWEVNLIGSSQVNAFCMPGGKIAFYSGILTSLKLTDDEVAIVMGHEVAHALREHARERMAKSELTQVGGALISQFFKLGNLGNQVLSTGANLLTLKFSRDDETEADIVGLDLAARAGFDPRAGVALWQKMAQVSKGAPPQWLSTHPAGENRIRAIESHLPEVMPLYANAIGLPLNKLPQYRTTVLR